MISREKIAQRSVGWGASEDRLGMMARVAGWVTSRPALALDTAELYIG
jgi:hypothetical protein